MSLSGAKLRVMLSVSVVTSTWLTPAALAASPTDEIFYRIEQAKQYGQPFDRDQAIDKECQRFLQFSGADQERSHKAEVLKFLSSISYPYFTPNTKLLAAIRNEGVTLAPKQLKMTPALNQLMSKYKIKAGDIDAECNKVRKQHHDFRIKKLSQEYEDSIITTTQQWLKKHAKELQEQKGRAV